MKTQKPYYITTEKISVGYDGKPLIEEVEIALRKGEILTLLGPNGAGKSTILKSIARQLSLIAGTVRLDGEDMKSLTGAELSKKMAVVMTKRLRGELMTCEDVVATGRYPYTGRFGVLSKDDHKAVENAMELVQVAEIGDSLFDRISDGQRQRILLARAICQEPEIIILDEPTVGLDPKQIIEIRTLIKELKKKHTVILSSHILSEVSAVCDYVLIISHGKLVASDTPENLGKLAEGSNTLEMLIKGEKTQIRLALEGIEGVNSVTMEKDEKQNLWSVKVSTEEQNDIREKVFYKMSEINSPIYEMKSRKVSLEEIFLELTASDKPISADEVPNTPEDKDTDAGRSNETNVKQTSAEIPEEQNNDKGGEK